MLADRHRSGHLDHETVSLSHRDRETNHPAILVPFQRHPPYDTMTRRHLDQSPHNFAICPNRLERHWFTELSRLTRAPGQKHNKRPTGKMGLLLLEQLLKLIYQDVALTPPLVLAPS